MANLFKDPWRLLVTVLVVANVAAVVAFVLMYQERTAALAALKDAQHRVDHSAKATIYEAIKRLGEVNAIKSRSGLTSTKSTDVEAYLRAAAQKAGLPVREIRSSDSPGRRIGDMRIRHYKFMMTFQGGNTGVDRQRLAAMLWEIKTRTPQIKITSIESGGSTDDWQKADKWDPRIEFILSKEEDASDT